AWPPAWSSSRSMNPRLGDRLPDGPGAQGRTAPDGPHPEEGEGGRHEARRREAKSYELLADRTSTTTDSLIPTTNPRSQAAVRRLVLGGRDPGRPRAHGGLRLGGRGHHPPPPPAEGIA